MTRGWRCGLLVCLLGWATGAFAQGEPTDRRGPRLSEERVVLHTDAGDLVIAFYPDVAPRHVAQLLDLMRLGAYDTTQFYRVEPGYLLQLSEARDRIVPLSPEQAAAIRPIPGEFSPLAHRPGALSMARNADDPDSAETSFSILLGNASHLDGQFTIFGEVVDGWDVLGRLGAVERNARGVPLVRVQLRATTVVETPDAVPPLAPARSIVVPVYVRERAEAERVAAMGPPPSRAAWAGVGLVVVVTIVGFAIAYRRKEALIGALFLLATLVSSFVLFAVFVPQAERDPWIGLGAFLGALALFRLMGWFESSRR